jgi:hypothetical protein
MHMAKKAIIVHKWERNGRMGMADGERISEMSVPISRIVRVETDDNYKRLLRVRPDSEPTDASFRAQIIFSEDDRVRVTETVREIDALINRED